MILKMCPDYQKIVESIDSNLNFVEDLSLWYPSYLVFHVKDKENKKSYILKAGNDTIPPKQIDKEIQTLKLASGTKHMPNLIKEYGVLPISLKYGSSAEYNTILKEYLNGKKAKYFTESAKLYLEGIVNHLHKIGIANLDISTRNIIISPNETLAMLFDFDVSVFKQDIPYSDFQYFQKLDMLNLTDLCQYLKSSETIKKSIHY